MCWWQGRPSSAISARFSIPRVYLLNDLEATAIAVPHLGPDQVATLNPGAAAARGNIAVVAPGTGLGVGFLFWIGGGIPPRILKRLQQPDFLTAIADKGRFSDFLSSVPVQVILNPKVALHGAAWFGEEQLAGG